MDKKQDIIYASGYTDGDGCFSIIKNRNTFNTTFVISSTNVFIINYFANVFGGYTYKNKQLTSNKKTVFHLVKNGKQSYKFAKQLFPYLVQRKEECRLFISFFEISSKTEKIGIMEKLKLQHRKVNLISFEDIEKLKYIKQIEPIEEDFIYMAGFIDAECCLTIGKWKPKNEQNAIYQTIIQLNDTQSPMFYWIKARFGGHCSFRKKSPPCNNQICWRLCAKLLYPLLKRVLPYLRYKKPVCEKLIEFYETTLNNGGDRHTEKFRTSYAATIAKRESIYQQVHILNHKGL